MATNEQIWITKYQELNGQLIQTDKAIAKYPSSDALALNEAKRLKLRLEYQINQHIESAYTAEMLDVYNAYQDERFTQLDNVPIDGILYNNTGQPLSWDPNTTWGFYNELQEVRNFVRSTTDYIVASSLQAQKANISLLFSNLLGAALDPGDNVFNSVMNSPNRYLQRMAVDTMSLLFGKAEPVNPEVGKVTANTIYEFFYGDYDPSFHGLELPPSLLQNSTNSFFLAVEDYQIEQAISQLSLVNTEFSLLDLLDQAVNELNIGVSALTEPAQNPTIFDLSTDLAQLKPEDNTPVGSTTDGWGLLQSEAGWQAKMASNFVNDNGLVNTSGSNIVAESRVGNVSPNDTAPLVDGVRSFNFNDHSHSDSTAVTLVLGQTSSEPGTVTFSVDGVSGSFSGIIHYDALNNPISVTPDAGQNVTVKLGYGQEVILDGSQDLVFSPNQTQNTDGSFNLAGWFLVDPQNSAYQLKLSKLAKNIAYTDPLSLDSGNDGIRFSAQPGNFDLDSDGVAESIRWTSPADPLLVLDANHDGRINNGSELVDLTGTANPVNLLSLDNNGDGILNAADGNAFTDLQLWQDRNQDGYASTEERQTLMDVGITSIELNPVTDTVAGIANVQGVIAHYSDGSQRTLWDVPLQPTTTASVTTTAYTPSIDKITGSGQTALVAKSAFGVTLDLNNSGADQAIGFVGDDTLIGTDNNDWLTGGAGSDTFVAGAGSDILIIDADDRQDNIDAGSGIDTLIVADDRSVLINLAKINAEVVYGGYGNDVLVGGGSDNYFIAGAAGDDLIIGGRVDDVLSGEDGNDVIDGGLGDDLIRGHRGKDQLFGGYGNDVLDGGLGDDDLQGGNGNDILIESSGNDLYDGGVGTDLLQLNGELQDYTFTQNSDQSYTVINHTAEQTTQMQVSNIERFSFKRGERMTVLEFGLNNPVLVNDRINITAGQNSYSIPIYELLKNDLDFQHLANPEQALNIGWVGDVIGGQVELQGSNVIFTPTTNFTGALEFNYTVKDEQGNKGVTLTNVADASISGEMKGRVLLVPDDAPSDPDYAKQWYLGATGITNVWQKYTGKGVNVLVLDPSGEFAVAPQAADLNHPDLVANQSADFNDTLDHATHATQVAGVIAAARNNIGGVGVAYDATLDAIGIFGDTGSYDRNMTRMQDYDVVNNSWGYPVPSIWLSNLSELQEIDQRNIKIAALAGRNGLGTIMVFAAGNDREKGSDAGLSSLVNNPYTINVGGINRTGDIGSGFGAKAFSERGANILLAAPASNIITSSIEFTTNNGSVIGDASKEVKGTSFAAPIISGVAALMLEANPSLSYRDIQAILAVTARQYLGDGTQADTIWRNNQNLDWNGQGMHYSHDFGFGMVDALAAVHMAESWTHSSATLNSSIQYQQTAGISDLGQKIVEFQIDDALEVEHAVIEIQLNHERWSDLVLTLISPQGTSSLLLDRPGYNEGQVYLNNPDGVVRIDTELMSTHFRGEQSQGTWKLIIEDKAAGSSGSGEIYSTLEVFGSTDNKLQRFILTDEYAGGWIIQPDTERQTELNASALSQGQTLNTIGSSIINGKILTVNAGIDRLIGGTGNDVLNGNGENNTLIGGNGQDSLNGGAGHDFLQGGHDNDTLHGGAGQDLLIGDEGNDQLYGENDADVFFIESSDRADNTTTIHDFSAASGDTVLLRTPIAFTLNELIQQVDGSDLSIRFNTSGRERTVILKGITTPLSDTQLRLWEQGRPVPVLVGDGEGFTSENTMTVVPVATVNGIYDSREVIRSGPGFYISTWENFLVGYELGEVMWKPGNDTNDLLVVGATPPPPQHITQTDWDNAINALGQRIMDGRGGHDEIRGSGESEQLIGGDGDDILIGGGGNDYLRGDWYGYSGNDTYVFQPGHGDDEIIDMNPFDTLHFKDLSIQALHTNFDYGYFNNYGSLPIDIRYETEGGNSIHFELRLSEAQLLDNSPIALYRQKIDNAATETVWLVDAVMTQGNDFIRAERLTNADFDTLDGDDVVYALKKTGITIRTGNGNDRVWAISGGQEVFAGKGNDLIELFKDSVIYNMNTLHGGDGDDQLYGGLWSDTLNGDAGIDYLVGRSGDDFLYGGADNDTLIGGSGNDFLDGGAGQDILTGGDDTYIVDEQDQTNEGNGGGIDEVRSSYNLILSANIETGLLLGQQASLTLTGNTLENHLQGNGAGSVLEGLTGNDTYIITHTNDRVIEQEHGGLDTIKASFDHRLADYVENVISTGLNLNLLGNYLDNHLTGDEGNNVLDGGQGIDLLEGGKGDDVYYVDSQNDNIIELTGQGNDVVLVENSYSLTNINNDIEEMRANSNAGVVMSGNDLNNKLIGKDGNDMLDGGKGIDTLIGGFGDDVYRVDESGDVIQENKNAGIDKVESNAYFYQLKENIENIALINDAAGAFGNDLDNIMEGNAISNVLVGFDGNDSLKGGDGNDSLFGGLGADRLEGGKDDDVLQGGGGGDVLIGGVGEDIYKFSSYDLINGALSSQNMGFNVIYGDSFDTLKFIDLKSTDIELSQGGWSDEEDSSHVRWRKNVEGAELNLMFSSKSNPDADLILWDFFKSDGHRGSNQLGNIEFNDGVIWGFGDIVEQITQQPVLEDYKNYKLYGTENADELMGFYGNDELKGGGGGDVLTGGEGVDIYIFSNEDLINGSLSGQNNGLNEIRGDASDILDLTAFKITNLYFSNIKRNELDDASLNLGISRRDQLDGSVVLWDFFNKDGSSGNNKIKTFKFADGIEWSFEDVKLTFEENFKNLDLKGNSIANVLTGLEANDRLQGGGGGDILIGGIGEDIYKFSSQDLINGSLNSQNMGLNEIRGDSDDTLEFTDLNSTDIKVSHGGWSDEEDANDIRWRKNGDDHKLNIMFSRKDNVAGSVVIWDFFKQDGTGGRHQLGSVTFADGVVWAFNDIKQEFLKGSSYGDYITGYSTDDVIFGYAGNDTLKALGGNDLLIGGAGYDRLYGGEGNDTYLFGRGDGMDRIIEYNTSPDNDLVEFTNGIDYSQLWFTHKAGSNDLEVSIIGTDDKVLINNWYGNNGSTIDQFTTQDNGFTLLESHVENLVSAMAAFNPPAAGETVLPPEYQSSIAPVLAANWQ